MILLNPLSAKTLIVSDIDDTIKMTDILGAKVKVAVSPFFEVKAFAGMNSLYENLLNEETKIYYISGSPQYIRNNVENYLSSHHFPQFKNLILRTNLSDDIFKVKYYAITKLISEEKPDKVLFIGDDTEYDPEVYEQLSLENPGLVNGIYIRSVQNRYIGHLEGVKSFFAPLEIALAEIKDLNLSPDKVNAIAQDFLKDLTSENLAIAYRYCPVLGSRELSKQVQNPELVEYKELITATQEKIQETCLQKKKSEEVPKVNNLE